MKSKKPTYFYHPDFLVYVKRNKKKINKDSFSKFMASKASPYKDLTIQNMFIEMFWEINLLKDVALKAALTVTTHLDEK